MTMTTVIPSTSWGISLAIMCIITLSNYGVSCDHSTDVSLRMRRSRLLENVVRYGVLVNTVNLSLRVLAMLRVCVCVLLASQVIGHTYFSPLDFLSREKATVKLGERDYKLTELEVIFKQLARSCVCMSLIPCLLTCMRSLRWHIIIDNNHRN